MVFEIDTQASQPIYEQLRDQIVLGIAAGRLVRGEWLPSVRQMASDLGINLHTVNKAYTLLCGEGYAVMDRRRGAAVAAVIDGDAIRAGLMRSITLSAAEARCASIDEDTFAAICRECYRRAGRKETGGDDNAGA